MVRLHPRVFREQFGEEMMWIFEEATETHGAFRLLGDGILSLARQWVFRPRSLEVPVTAGAVSTSREPAWFAWEHINASPSRLPAARWLQGGLMSMALFAGVWLAAAQVARKAHFPRAALRHRPREIPGPVLQWAALTNTVSMQAQDRAICERCNAGSNSLLCRWRRVRA